MYEKCKNELKQFVAGVVMLIVGLFILPRKLVYRPAGSVTAEQLCLVVSV